MKLIFTSAVVLGLAGMTTNAMAAAADGEKVFQESCSECHNAKQKPLDKVQLSREKWKEEAERMADMGAKVPSGKRMQDLLDYLAQTHGPGGASAQPSGK
jgi:mono/diheme cytochrome c family protein